jgi:hypothetical protein
MIDRAAKRFGLCPKRLAADTAYGSGGMLAWLMERGIEPHIPVLDRAGQTNGTFTRKRLHLRPRTQCVHLSWRKVSAARA